MKVLALAFVLLAVGAHAWSIQADAPDQLAHVRSEALRVDLEPKRAALKEVIDRHIADYRTRIESIVTEYSANHSAEMEVLKTKLDPILADLQVKSATNVEETKAAMMPIVEAVRTKLSERLEQLKAMASPYVEEQKEQVKNAYSQAQSINTDDVDALRDKIQPLAEKIKVKMQAIYEAITKSN